MNESREKAKSAVVGVDVGGTPRDTELVRRIADSDDARRAALNLLEDAVEARQQAEHAVTALQQSEARHAFLLMLSDALRSVDDPIEVQGVASRILGEYLYASRVMYLDIEPDGERLVIRDDYTFRVPSFAGHYHLSDFGSHLAQEFLNGRTLAFTNVESDERFTPKERELLITNHVRAWIGVPIVKAGKLVSILAVHQSQPRNWRPSDLSLVEEVAHRTRASAERALAEARTRQAEDRYLTLLNSIDQGFCTIEVKFDEKGRCVDYKYLEASPSFERQTGIEDPTGKWMRDIAPDHDQVWFDIFGKVAKTGISERFEEYSTPLARWWSVYAFRVDDPDLHHVAVVLFDITRRRESERQLRETKERFETAQNAGNVGVWSWEPDTGTFWSDTMWKIYGYSERADSPEKLWEKHLHPDDAAEAQDKLWNLVNSDATRYQDEFRIIGADGRAGWIESVAQIIRDEAGKVTRVSGVNLDITDRRRAEQALRESEERLRLLTESFQDIAIVTSDTTGDVVTWNPGAQNIFGYEPQEIIGRNSRILFVPEDQEKGESDREMELARRTGRAADERWHLRKDGSRFYASGVMAPLYDGGVLIGYAKIARDLTLQKQAEEELRRQHEELESIVAGRTAELAEANEALRHQMEERRVMEEERVALLQRIVTTLEDERRRIARDMHDSLGQQLTALRLKIASMKNDSHADRRILENLDRLEQLGKGIDSEVNFLVWELRPTVLDDLGLVAAIENFAREWSRHYGIASEVHTARFGKERVNPDIETNLYRILQEALNNTHKHAEASGVNIVLESRRKEIVLVIEDDGQGFEPDKVRMSRDTGGFGLIGMRERAAIIGGRVEIESSRGQGTTVFVRVPVT